MYKYRIPNEFNQADKLGKLAMPQAIVLAIGITIFVLCVITLDLIISLIVAVPIGLATLVFMFVRINRIPLYEFLMIYLLYMGTPKLLIYRSDNLKSLEEQEDSIGFIEYQKSAKKETPDKRINKPIEKKRNENVQSKSKKPKKIEQPKNSKVKKKGVKN